MTLKADGSTPAQVYSLLPQGTIQVIEHSGTPYTPTVSSALPSGYILH